VPPTRLTCSRTAAPAAPAVLPSCGAATAPATVSPRRSLAAGAGPRRRGELCRLTRLRRKSTKGTVRPTAAARVRLASQGALCIIAATHTRGRQRQLQRGNVESHTSNRCGIDFFPSAELDRLGACSIQGALAYHPAQIGHGVGDRRLPPNYLDSQHPCDARPTCPRECGLG
jgi:hypothetical protein